MDIENHNIRSSSKASTTKEQTVIFATAKDSGLSQELKPKKQKEAHYELALDVAQSFILREMRLFAKNV